MKFGRAVLAALTLGLGGCAVSGEGLPSGGEDGPDAGPGAGDPGGADDDPGGDGDPGGGEAAVEQLQGAPSTAAHCYNTPAGEEVGNLTDGDPATKFLVFRNSVWVELDVSEPYVLRKYAITSADDFPERDPFRWILMGSNDGKTWTEIDVRMREDFPNRFQRREFEVTGAGLYRFYRLRMENETSGIVQLAELELYGQSLLRGGSGATPAAPADLTASATARRRIELAWSDRSEDEVLFRIERSLDGATWSTVAYAPADSSTYSATELAPEQLYYYRVSAENESGRSTLSNTATAETLPPVQGSANGDGTRLYAEGGYTLTVDVQDPATPRAMIDDIVYEFFETYPKMYSEYGGSGRKDVRVTFDPTYDGVAYASFTTGDIVISSDWAVSAPFAIDVIAHEGFHIVQAYQNGNTPGWATEGLADFVRYRVGNFDGLECWTMQRYEPGQSYTDAYGVTARFLLWLESNVHPTLARELNATLRSGQYTDDFWVQTTGKSVEQLWEEYAADPDRAPVRYR